LNDRLEYCPYCHTNLQGDAIPEEQQKSYNATHFTRKIGMTIGEIVEALKCGKELSVGKEKLSKALKEAGF